MADPSSTGYHTDALPPSHDWYYYLRQGIPPVRTLSRPADPKKSMLPAFRTCSQGHLFRGLSVIHVAIVSPLRFSLQSFSKNGALFSFYRTTTPIGTLISWLTLSLPASYARSPPWSFVLTPKRFPIPGPSGSTPRPLLPPSTYAFLSILLLFIANVLFSARRLF